MKKFKKPDFKVRGGPKLKPRPDAQSRYPPGRCVVGIHAVAELIRVRASKITVMWIREKFNDHPALKELEETARKAKVKIETQPPGALDRVVSAHQGVLAWTAANPELDFRQLERAETATLIALDEVEDPHNLGAVLRTSWLLGGEGVLTPEHRAASLSPAVSKVAQGAVEHVPVVAEQALPQQLEELKKHGFWVLGLSHKAKQDLYMLDIPKKVVWVLGSESSGLRKSVEGVCDDLISIPQAVAEASYNVSVAAALALGETYRQRSQNENM